MFDKITPEQAGLPSDIITNFINVLERNGSNTHGFIFLKGGNIFAEGYYKPFDKDFCHRMYSQTKSFVGVAVGLLEEEGKLSLNDRIADYFPDKADGDLPRFLSEQTIENMLTMCTVGESPWWFVSEDPDRVHQYFNAKRRTARLPGTLWEYDSAGSQVLCVLVERLSGKSLLGYLKEKLFDRMGVFQNARILKLANGDSWGDSAMICTLRDMAAFGHFVMHYGVWNGERLMNENMREGDTICALGQFRSYNKLEGGRSRLMLTVFVREVLQTPPSSNPNSVVLSGYICKPPVYRTTPFNREIADLLIAVNRSYNKSDYIPAIAWGRNARFVAGMSVGDKVVLSGRIQSREYQKKQPDESFVTMTAYEVSVSKLALFDEFAPFDIDREFALYSPPRREHDTLNNG